MKSLSCCPALLAGSSLPTKGRIQPSNKRYLKRRGSFPPAGGGCPPPATPPASLRRRLAPPYRSAAASARAPAAAAVFSPRRDPAGATSSSSPEQGTAPAAQHPFPGRSPSQHPAHGWFRPARAISTRTQPPLSLSRYQRDPSEGFRHPPGEDLPTIETTVSAAG